MGGASREPTEAELIMNSIIYNIRGMDKLLWLASGENKFNYLALDLVEDAEEIKELLDKLIDVLRYKV